MIPDNLKGKTFRDKPERINRKGRPPVLPDLKETIAKILSEKKNELSGLEAILRAMLLKAVKGDTRAAQELLDRYYGKATQPVDHTTGGKEFNQIKIEVIDDEHKKIVQQIINGDN